MYQRPNGTWCDTLPQGKGKPPKFFYGKTKADVKRKMAEWQSREEDGILFKDAVDEWFEQLDNVKPRTRITYQSSIADLKEQFGETPLKQIEPAMILAMYRKYINQGRKYSFINTRRSILSSTFDYFIAKPDSVYKVNPCSSAKMPKEVKQSFRGLPPEDAVKKVKASVDCTFGLFAYLLLYTGLRRNEALALHSDDFDGDVIHVRHSLLWINNKTLIDTPKTASSIRDVIILKPLKDVLPKFSGYLFSKDGGKTPLTEMKFLTLWWKYCDEAGLLIEGEKHKAVITPHQLRHEFATMCYDADLDSKDTSELLGHADEATTRNIYTHIKDSRRQKTYTKLEQYVAEH